MDIDVRKSVASAPCRHTEMHTLGTYGVHRNGPFKTARFQNLITRNIQRNTYSANYVFFGDRGSASSDALYSASSDQV